MRIFLPFCRRLLPRLTRAILRTSFLLHLRSVGSGKTRARGLVSYETGLRGGRGSGGQVRPSEDRIVKLAPGSRRDGGPSYLCSISLIVPAKAGETSTALRRLRFRLVVFLVRMWLCIDW